MSNTHDTAPQGYVEYSTNNSGGEWWLKDGDWKALVDAGWEVKWFAEDSFYSHHELKDGRWLGALARSAIRRGLPIDEAIREFERVTGLDASDEGCNCCGQPHDFTEYNDAGKCVRSMYIIRSSNSWGVS